jgi:hypothetical protein
MPELLNVVFPFHRSIPDGFGSLDEKPRVKFGVPRIGSILHPKERSQKKKGFFTSPLSKVPH